jgi:hypothetical protein
MEMKRKALHNKQKGKGKIKNNNEMIRHKPISNLYDFEREVLFRPVEKHDESIYFSPSTDPLGTRIAVPVVKDGDSYVTVKKAEPGDHIAAYILTDKTEA